MSSAAHIEPNRDAAGKLHPCIGNAKNASVRIVSLVPSITELLFRLGLGEQVVGRTSFCIHPDAAHQVARVGGTKTVRTDKLLGLNPTHVIVNIDENTRETAETIAAQGPELIVTHPNAPDDNIVLYRLLGSIFGRAKAAEQLCHEFKSERARLGEAVAHLPRWRVLYLIWREPWMTISRDTYISRTLALAGWDTAGSSEGARYPSIELEHDSLGDIDAVLLSSEPYPFKDRHFQEVRTALAVGGIGNKRKRPLVRIIDGEMTSWYGSRAIKGLRYLAELAVALHAELNIDALHHRHAPTEPQ